jgi:hypothetical protein
MTKGYAFGFLIVLLVLALGLYVAFTGFMSSRDALRAQPTSPPSTKVVQSVQRSTPTVTASMVIIPTPAPGGTVTPTITVSGSAIEPSAPPTQPPAPPATEPPPQPSHTPVLPVQPPTPAPALTYEFRLAGPPAADPSYSICCYIFGTVRDAAGNGLEGVQVQAFNEWIPLPPAASKGGGELGRYDIPIGLDVVTWYVVVVDAAGNHISTQVPIPFDPNVSNGYRVDWQRTY